MAKNKKVVLFALIKDNKILLEKRLLDGFSNLQYLIPGGAINEDLESLEEALKREILEELGVIPTMFKSLSNENIPGINNNLLRPFIVTAWTGEVPQKVLDKEDPHPLEWVEIDRALDLLPIKASKEIMQALKDYLVKT